MVRAAALVLLALPTGSAFVTRPAVPNAAVRVAAEPEKTEPMDLDLEQMFEVFDEAVQADGGAPASAAAAVNGWSPDDTKFCYGLPGSLAPMGDFDPIGFARIGTPLNDIKRNREAEITHGRVAMLAAVGYLAGEAGSPVVWSGEIGGPANEQLAQIPGPLFGILTLFIGSCEAFRAVKGWKEPYGDGAELWALRDSYYPGDVGFDPLGLKPTDPAEFATMQTKELQNGRLAMLGVAGMCAQELVKHKTIMETIDFYQKYYGGAEEYIQPY